MCNACRPQLQAKAAGVDTAKKQTTLRSAQGDAAAGSQDQADSSMPCGLPHLEDRVVQVTHASTAAATAEARFLEGHSSSAAVVKAGRPAGRSIHTAVGSTGSPPPAALTCTSGSSTQAEEGATDCPRAETLTWGRALASVVSVLAILRFALCSTPIISKSSAAESGYALYTRAALRKAREAIYLGTRPGGVGVQHGSVAIQQGGGVTPVQQGGGVTPVQQGGGVTPVQHGGGVTPVQQGGRVTPVQQAGRRRRLFADSDAALMRMAKLPRLNTMTAPQVSACHALASLLPQTVVHD